MVISITDRARRKVLDVRSAEHEPEGLALWVEVTGIAGSQYTYDMSFLRMDEIDETDAVQEHDGLTIVVPRMSVDALTGATVDLDPALGGGLVLDNPNSPSPVVGTHAPGDLSGDVAQRVLQVLERQINPAIAMHGGTAELVAVEGDVAYLRLGGGCVGCGMAAVTLTQGIEVALLESVPEIRRIVDVTDHASGTNPYYEPAKK